MKTGKVNYFYETGNLRAEFFLTNKKLIGEYNEFFNNGQLRKQITFSDGEILEEIKMFTSKGDIYEKIYVLEKDCILNVEGVSISELNKDIPIVIDFLKLINNLEISLENERDDFNIEKYIKNEIEKERIISQEDPFDTEISLENHEISNDSYYEDDLFNYLENLSGSFIDLFEKFGIERKYRIINLDIKYFLILEKAIKNRCNLMVDLKLIRNNSYLTESDKDGFLDEIIKEQGYLKRKYLLNRSKFQNEGSVKLNPEDYDFSNL